MTTAVVNHLWQSTLFVAAAALVAFALRRNQARTRHAVWLAASLKFLLPFSILISLGGAFAWRSPAPVALAPTVVETVQTMTEPFAESAVGPTPPNASETQTAILWPAVLASVWMLGTLVVLGIRLRGWLAVWAVLRASTPVPLGDVEVGPSLRAAPGLLEPGVVGIWRPVLLVPVGLESTLSADQLRAIITHELHHIRRRDNLCSTLHMIVEALFWFHPLVWWVGARLIDERERACDEYVLASGAAADAYAEGILNVCKRYVESPVACVSGVTGSDLKKRVSAIVAGRVGLSLSSVGKAGLALAAVLALAVPVVAGMAAAAPRTAGQGVGPAPKFEAVSVRPCDPNAVSQSSGAGRGSGAAGGSPGRLNLACRSVLDLIDLAYGLYANGRVNTQVERPLLPRDGPFTNRDHYPMPPDLAGWVSKDRFTIEAKAEGAPPPQPVMLGSMLQQVLEDHFKLKVHHETRVVPVYELVIAKGGPKLTPVRPDTCAQYDFSVSPQPTPAPGQHRCANHNERDGNGDIVYMMESINVGEFFGSMALTSRPIVDKTGITGPVAFQFVVRGKSSNPDEEMAARISALRSELGLELRPGNDPLDFVVIDHVERPDAGDARAAGVTRAASAAAQSVATRQDASAIQKFDVVSIRPCAPGVQGPSRGDAARTPVTTPGRLYLECYPLSTMFQEAYLFFAGGRAHALGYVVGVGVEGGPDWMKTDRYTIEAKTDQDPAPAVMRGPMLQAVLEDRFKLKVHRETREMPTYELVAATSGVKVSPYTSHDCVITDDAAWPVPALPAGQSYCGARVGIDGDRVVRSGVTTLDQLASSLPFDRPVVNKTGVRAPVAYQFGYDRADAGTQQQPGASIVRALRDQLGLELHASKGPREFLVIDHAEPPKGDSGGADK